MVLLECPECGGKTSSRADACPHCGFPVTSLLASVVSVVTRVIVTPVVGYYFFAGYVIVLTSDEYSAKEALVAFIFPPYAWYIAVVWAIHQLF